MRIIAIAAAALIAGCAEMTDRPGSGAGARGAAAPEDAAAIEATGGDALAPEIFEFAGEGLWDGRPSLGGVWVAHPEAGEPGRVVIRHEASGEAVRGALFRREREAAGPALQVSSDAALALGLLAGQPARLSVTALRPAPQVPDGADADGTEADGTEADGTEADIADAAEAQDAGAGA